MNSLKAIAVICIIVSCCSCADKDITPARIMAPERSLNSATSGYVLVGVTTADENGKKRTSFKQGAIVRVCGWVRKDGVNQFDRKVTVTIIHEDSEVDSQKTVTGEGLDNYGSFVAEFTSTETWEPSDDNKWKVLQFTARCKEEDGDTKTVDFRIVKATPKEKRCRTQEPS